MAKKPTWGEVWGSSEPNYWKSTASLRKDLEKVRQKTFSRYGSLTRNKAFSYAAHALEQNLKRNYIQGRLPSVEDMSQKQIEKELRIYHQFWSSKTSSLAGAREERKSQSARIFGTTPSGRPKRYMSYDESVMYWEVYDKFYEMFKGKTARFSSETVQQMLGESIDAMPILKSDDKSMEYFLNQVYKDLSKEEQEYANVTGVNSIEKNWNSVYRSMIDDDEEDEF